MLTPPQYGWTVFTQPGGTRYFNLGYITDVAMEWLDGAIFGLTYDNPFIVKGFCEPCWMVCAVTADECLLYCDDSIDPPDVFRQPPLAVSPVRMTDFCRALHDDIANHLSAWVDWELFDEEGPEADQSRAAREDALRTRLQTLKSLLDAIDEDEEETEE